MMFGYHTLKDQDIPFSLLEINHRRWHKEAMATGSCTNACDIKMGTTGVGLLNGPLGIACTWLLES